MHLQPREALLDIEWLVRTHSAEGVANLARYLRTGAEVYGEPVTAVADAVLPHGSMALHWRDDTDVRHALPIKLLAGSWSGDPDGPQNHHTLPQVWASTFPEAKRAEWMQRVAQADLEVAVPDLSQLRLIEPMDRAWVGHTDGIWGCDVSADGRCVISASRDGDVSVWDMDAGTLIARGRTGIREIRDCAVTPDGRRVISVHSNGRVTVWDLPTMAVAATLDAPPRGPTDVQQAAVYEHELCASPRRWRRFAVSPDSRRLAVAGWESVDIWDPEHLGRVATLEIEPKLPPGMLALFFVSDTLLTTIGRSPRAPVSTWDLPTQRLTAESTLRMPRAATVATALPTSSGHLVTASSEETAVWQIGEEALVATAPFGVAGRALAVSNDGRYAATASGRDLRLWSLPHLHELHRWDLMALGLWDISCALAFVPGGRHLIVAGWEGVLRRVVLPDL